MFRFIVENAPLGVLAVNFEGAIAYSNKAAAKVLSLKLDNMIGMQIAEAAPGIEFTDGALVVVAPSIEGCDLFKIAVADGTNRYLS